MVDFKELQKEDKKNRSLSYLETLLQSDEDLKKSSPKEYENLRTARNNFIDSYALSSEHAKAAKKVLEGKGLTRAEMSNLNAVTAAISNGVGAVAKVDNAAFIAGSIASLAGNPAVGSAVQNTMKSLLRKIPYIDTILAGISGGLVGVFCGSAYYLYAFLKSKSASLDQVKNDLDLDLTAWEREHLQSKNIHLQHAVEILTKYLRKKAQEGAALSGNTVALLLRIQAYAEPSFIRINSYIKALLMFVTYADSLSATDIKTYLDIVHLDLSSPQAIKEMNDKEIFKIFLEFKKYVFKYLKHRDGQESTVELMGRSLVLGSSAVTPTLPILASLYFNDLYFYNAKKFKKSLFRQISKDNESLLS
ncbi:MAG: hypothetical protein K2X39_06510, partial [Silvanigrellaceae bacterium]|nr:hypothetical protein [Silvanigrellaceae bacterium]